MKIRAFVNCIAPDAATGKTVNMKPESVADIREDKAQYLIDEGYAEEVVGKAEKVAKPKGGDTERRAPRQPRPKKGGKPEIVQKSTEDDKGGRRVRNRNALTGGRARNPDTGGENGNGDGEE